MIIGSENYLCTVEDVERVAGLNAMQDTGSEEVEVYITDATQEVYDEYGDDVVHESIKMLQSGSSVYQLPQEDYPIYKVEEVYLEDDTTEAGSVLLDTGSYEINKANGEVTVTDDIHQNYDGNDLTVHSIPYVYHALAKNIAGYELLSNNTVMNGDDTESPRLRRLGSRITKYRNNLNPYQVFRG